MFAPIDVRNDVRNDVGNDAGNDAADELAAGKTSATGMEAASTDAAGIASIPGVTGIIFLGEIDLPAR